MEKDLKLIKGKKLLFTYNDVETQNKTITVEAIVKEDGNIFNGILNNFDKELSYGVNIEFERKFFNEREGFCYFHSIEKIYDLKNVQFLD